MRKLLKLAEAQHGVIARWQALDFVGKAALDAAIREGQLECAVRTVYRVVGSPRTWRQRVMIAVLAAGPGAAASGKTAAALHGIRGYGEGPIEVTQTRRPSRRYKVADEHSSRRLLMGVDRLGA